MCVCAHVRLCAHDCRQGGKIRIRFILSFWICHKSTCRIIPVLAAPASMCACEFVCLSVIVASRQGHLEWVREMKDINNASKYRWLPLETCMPYAELMHMIKHSYSWLTAPLLFLLSSLILFLLSHLGHKQSQLRNRFFVTCFLPLQCSANTSRQLRECVMKAALDNTASPRGQLVWK